MAYEIPVLSISLVAASDLSASQYKFVKLDTAGLAAAVAAATDVPVGVLQNKPTAGQTAAVMVYGVTKVQGDADLARGNLIGTSADGQADAKTPGTDTTEYVRGIVLEDNAAAAGLATVLLIGPYRAS